MRTVSPALIGIKAAALAALAVSLLWSGGFPSSFGDAAFFALALALPLLGALRCSAAGWRGGGLAHRAASVVASLLALLIAVNLAGLAPCGGDGLGCEVAILFLAPVYAALEIFGLTASRRAA